MSLNFQAIVKDLYTKMILYKKLKSVFKLIFFILNKIII